MAGRSVVVRMEQDLIERVDAAAAAAGYSRSEWIRATVEAAATGSPVAAAPSSTPTTRGEEHVGRRGQRAPAATSPKRTRKLAGTQRFAGRQDATTRGRRSADRGGSSVPGSAAPAQAAPADAGRARSEPCRHPVTRRIGNGCGACGAPVR